MDYSEQNAKIARLVGWTNNADYGRWVKPDGFSKNNPELPPNYCSDNNLAAEFRQHTMKQEWFGFFEVYPYCDGGVCFNVGSKVIGRTLASKVAETEAAASSLACLAAWEAMEGSG